MPLDRVKLSAAVRNRADRAFPRGVAVAGVLTAGAVAGNRAFPSEVGAKVLLAEEVSEGVKRGNRAAAALQAVKAHPQEGAVGVPLEVAAVAEEVAEGDAAVAAAVAAGRLRRREEIHTIEPWRRKRCL